MLFDQLIELIEKIVWPISTLIIFFSMRKPLLQLIPKIKKLKYKDVELDIRDELNEIKENFENSGVEIISEKESNDDIYKLVQSSPALTIIDAWKQLEEAARQKVFELSRDDRTLERHLNNPVHFILYTNALFPDANASITKMRILRNKIVHNREYDIQKNDAIDYINITKTIIEKINNIEELPKMRLTALTFLILQLNSLIDSGLYDNISINEV